MLNMDMSPIGEAALVGREGRRLKAYRDSKGILTISTGITSASGLIKVTPGLTITAAESDALFAKALKKYVATVNAALKVPVSQNCFDALVSVCFNIGEPRFKTATFVKRINQGDMAGAQAALLWWDQPKEIIARREGEADQLLIPYTTKLPSARRGERPVAIAAPVADVLDPAKKVPKLVPIIVPAKPTKTQKAVAAVKAAPAAPATFFRRLMQAFDAFWAPLPHRA